MRKQISKQSQNELTDAIRQRYNKASKQERTRILDEFIALNRCHRNQVIGLLSAVGCASRQTRNNGRCVYDEAVKGEDGIGTGGEAGAGPPGRDRPPLTLAEASWWVVSMAATERLRGMTPSTRLCSTASLETSVHRPSVDMMRAKRRRERGLGVSLRVKPHTSAKRELRSSSLAICSTPPSHS
jgi:hypothetical protein